MKHFIIYTLFFVLSLSGCSGTRTKKKSTRLSKDQKNRRFEVWNKAKPVRSAAPNLWVLAVGVSKYKNKNMNLKYANTDAKAIVTVLKKQKGKLFDEVYVRLLIDEDVSRSSILNSVIHFLNQAAPEDLAFIFMEGYGVEDKEKSYYFLPYSAHKDNLISRGLNFIDFKRSLLQLHRNVNNIILVMDICNNTGKIIDMNKIFGNMDGTYILSITRKRNFSFRASFSEYGILTQAILEGFDKGNSNNDNILTFDELSSYVSKRVPQLSNGQQNTYQMSPMIDLPISKK